MTKAQVMELVNRYNMQELINNEIERTQIGWSLLSDEYIDQLDNIANGYADTAPVTVTAHYTGYEHQTLYKIIVPASWINSTPGHKSSRTYWIDYLTGVGDFEITGTLEEAKRAADKGAAYTQRDILIYEQIKLDGPGDMYDSELVCGRVWYGYEYDPETDDCDDPIIFGSHGFYADWEDAR